MNETAVKGILGTVLALAAQTLGGWDDSLAALVALIIADYITGFLAAAYHKELNSQKGAKGIIKKVFYLAVVMVAYVVDSTINLGGRVRDMVIFFFIINESISILENAAGCGLPIPKFLVEKLEQLRDKGEKD